MTKKVITWLGEDVGETAGPSFNLWGDPLTRVHVKFEKDKGVLISDEDDADPNLRALEAAILAAAPTNRFYKVEDYHGPAAKEEEPHRKPARSKKADDE